MADNKNAKNLAAAKLVTIGASPKRGTNTFEKVKSLLGTKTVVECLQCGHEWTYKGSSAGRVHCPKCGSTQNEYNRTRLGKWYPP